MDSTHQRLDDLKTQQAPARSASTAPPPSTSRTLAEVLGGGPATCRGGPYWQIQMPLDAVRTARWPTGHDLTKPYLFPRPPDETIALALRRTLVLDVETGGFAGSPVFLIGLVLFDGDQLAVRQFLARDYPEEAAILWALADLVAGHDTWVTFNGKAFDHPMLHDRAVVHRVKLPSPRVHIDLLHAARRAWRGRLPDFRLATLERQVLQRARVGDIPSRDVPDLFHHFMRTGNAGPLRPVLEHNRLDLASATELLLRLTQRPARA